MPLNFSLGGKAYPPARVTVDPVAVARYAAAVGDHHPRYAVGPGQIVPPLFPVVFGFPQMMMMGADLGVDNLLMILHGEQEMVYHRPLGGGEDLVLHPALERVEDKGSGAVFVTAVRAGTPDGDPVVDQFSTIFVRGAGSGAERPASDAPPEETGGPIAATFTRHVDPDMPARYAEASGDHNPIHLDPGVAAAVGLPGVINHGLGTCALVAGGLVDAVLDGDAAGLERIAARFTGMVFPGDDLETVVRQADDHGFRFETTRSGGPVVMTGAIRRRGI